MRDLLNVHYILDEDGEPVPAELLVWAEWLERSHAERVVLQTHIDRHGRATERPIERGAGGVFVSTVFLSLDHNFSGGPPVLWESMIFGGLFNGDQNRYTSKLAALSGHQQMVARVQSVRRVPRYLKRAITKQNAYRSLTRREQRAIGRFENRHAA